MELSAPQSGHQTSFSPCGTFIVCADPNGRIRLQYAHAQERCTEIDTRIPTKECTGLKWSQNATRLAICSAKLIEVIDLDDAAFRVRIENGSGGLGKLTTAQFIDEDRLLTVWEFGRAKVWDFLNGKTLEVGDIKTTTDGAAWQIRPCQAANQHDETTTLAVLSRTGVDDLLTIHFPLLLKSMQATKIATTDAQSISWSPDGRWLAVVDTPTAAVNVRIFTPNGHPFRTFPAKASNETTGLGVKTLAWSADSSLVALSKFDGTVVLLNTKTFAPLAIVEHTTTIHQHSLPVAERALVWQEALSASGQRSYSLQSQPVSPPLTRIKTSNEPSELGVEEAAFSSDGSFLATRDSRMLNTVWVWTMSTLAPHAILMQHNNIRKLHWHPFIHEMLLLDCGEGVAYLFNASTRESPTHCSTSLNSSPHMSWLPTRNDLKPAILMSTKSTFRLLYPSGADPTAQATTEIDENARDFFDEGASEDSVFDILSGRKPMPPKTEPSYTERIDLEADADDEYDTARLDDTFREKKVKPLAEEVYEIDPLDDSQIF